MCNICCYGPTNHENNFKIYELDVLKYETVKGSDMASIPNNRLIYGLVQTTKTKDSEDLTLGYLRYEALRKLNVRQYQDLFLRCLKSDRHFDDLVDDLIENELQSKAGIRT